MNDIFVSSAERELQRDIARGLAALTHGKSARVITFGCQQNEADSERISGLLAECGYEMTEKSDADLIIINTCAIREHAEIRALSEAGQFKSAKEKNPDMRIGLCGCMVQQEGRREQISKSYPYVDFVFGTDMLHRLPEIISASLGTKKRVSFVSSLPHSDFGIIAEELPIKRESTFRAWLPVMYGCDNFCSYCVVPSVRGRERSRKRESVLAEAKTLIDNGCRDITLLGQNVNSYSGGCDFASLLTDVCSFGNEYRVRFMTSHPKDASSALIRAIAENGNAAKHFHLPVQSGSDRILRAMNRRYTRAQYLEKAMEIRETVAGVALTTDVICGFPGETDEDFEQTLSLVREIGFDMIFTFIYSKRPGTPAAEMEGQIPRDIAGARFNALSELENGIAQSINDTFVGKSIRVLSEGYNKNGLPCGRSSGNKPVTLDRFVPEGVFCDAKIEKAGNYSLSGTVI